MLWRIYMHTKRLRNELLQEKDSLTASEKQLRVVTKEAEAANKKKSAFIANISHEVRTPLNAIVGFSELLASSEYSEEEKIRFAGEVNHSSELLLNLVNDVLDLSRLESGKIKFSVKPNDLVACCQRALDSIRHRVKPGVRLTFTPSIESYTLNTDALRLQQLLTNLLSNAAKFTSEGEINLSFTVDEGKEEVRFPVTDTGCGIPEDKCEKIFERFEKLDDFIQGTGLGLSVCQIISEQLNGSLSVDISYKDGARFVFIHPTNLIEDPHMRLKNRLNNWISIRMGMVIVIFLGVSCGSMRSSTPPPAKDRLTEIDSLERLLPDCPTIASTLPLLRRLAFLYQQQSEMKVYNERLYENAMAVDSISVAYLGLKNLAEYYYDQSVRDSLEYYCSLVDSIAKARHEYPNVLFDVKSLSSQDLLWLGNYELAMSEAMDLYRLASNLDHRYGLLRCSETLGLIYQRIRRDSDAVVSFQESLDLLKDIKNVPDIMDTKVRLTSYQLESSVRTKQYASTERILGQYKALLDE